MPRKKAVQTDATPVEASGRHTATLSPWATAKVINLTEQVVKEEAEAMLADCDSDAYQELFAMPSERQRLIHYATNRVRNIYMVVSDPVDVKRHYARAMVQKPAIQEALGEGMQVIADIYFQEDSQFPEPMRFVPVLTSYMPHRGHQLAE